MAQAVEERVAKGETLNQFLEDRAGRFGPRTALLFKPGFRYQRWSYAQLWEGAGRVASLLQQRGLSKGDRALLWAHNCPQWVLAFFGCLRAGVVVVPLDLRSSSDFVQKVASKTAPKMAFISRVTPPAHEELSLPEVRLEELDALTDGLAPADHVDVRAEDLAEIMFTSGTTGDPKGVMLSHGNLTADLEAASEYVRGEPSDRLLSILPLSHMFEQMGGLLLGLRDGANVTYPTSRQPTVLFRTMSERKATLMLLVPQALDLFMKGIEREVRRQGKERTWRLSLKVARYLPMGLRRLLFRKVHRRFGGSLRLVFSGGAALDPELGEKWTLIGVNIIQGYGATEASPVISCHRETDPRYDSVGLPLPGVQVKISESGEVLVKGPNIMSGYWEAPEPTTAAFEDGWYKTGDQGFFDAEGFLHLKGRVKDMIVLSSGQNVFPEDIETVLKRQPEVQDAVVVGLPKGSDVEVHAALRVEGADAAGGAVALANSQLAEHQQIRGFTVWPDDDFPRTHTLKVKKGLVVDILQSAESGPAAAGPPSEKPQDSATADIAGLIAEIGGLKPTEVTPEKTLGTDLNLDSLRRVELLSAIEGDLGVYLDESQVSDETTVQELHDLVGQGARDAADMRFPGWGMSWWCRPLRGVIQRALIFPLLRWAYRLTVTGTENLEGSEGPVLIAANHSLTLDNGLIIKSFPSHIRRRLAIAAAARLWGSPFWATINPLIGNGFPFSQEGAIRASLDNLGRIVDNGWSVLIYPEGKKTHGGPIQPFMSGTGLLAVGGNLSVVPLRLHIHKMGIPGAFPLLRRGDIEICFGKPLTFSPETTHLEATAAIEEAVRAL